MAPPFPQPHGRSRVRLWNLEDPHEEIVRHIQATALHFKLSPKDVDGHLWVDSGRDQRLVTATTSKDGVVILQFVIDNLVVEILARSIDVLVVDPLCPATKPSKTTTRRWIRS